MRYAWLDQPHPCDDQPELFFPPDMEDGEVEHGRSARIAAAQAVCATCPFTAECKEYGSEQEYGVWGGVDVERTGRRWMPAEQRPETPKQKQMRERRETIYRMKDDDPTLSAEDIRARLGLTSRSSVIHILATRNKED